MTTKHDIDSAARFTNGMDDPVVEHTPGPWDDASQYPYCDSVRIFAKAHYIATVGNCGDPKEVTLANARLIAKAPEMAALLRDALEQEQCVCSTDRQCIHCRIKALNL